MLAATQKDWKTVSHLVASGIDVYKCDTKCETQLQSTSAVQLAVEDKQWELVNMIWQTSIMFDDVAHDPYTTHALEPIVLIAARHGEWHIVTKWMGALSKHQEAVRKQFFNLSDREDHTLLWYASKVLKWHVVEELLMCGVTDRGVCMHGENKNALIMIAARNCAFSVVNLLLSVNPDVPKQALQESISGWNKLVYLASEANLWRLVRILCGRGIDARLWHTMVRQKPLVRAATCQEWDTVLYMLRSIMKHFSRDKFASFLTRPLHTVWSLDDTTYDSQTTENILVLLASKAKQWEVVAILIKFFDANPNACYNIDDKLEDSLFGMAALSRQWLLCGFLFQYKTSVAPQNISVSHCTLLKWFVDRFQWGMVSRMVQGGYVCVLGNQHPQCSKIYSEIMQTAVEKQKWKLVHAMLTHGIQANAFLTAESVKYDNNCVQNYVCRRLYGNEFDEDNNDEIHNSDTKSSHDAEEVDTDSVQSFDPDVLLSRGFDAILDDDEVDTDSVQSFDPDILLSRGFDAIPDDESMQSFDVDVDMPDDFARVRDDVLSDIASDADSMESFDATVARTQVLRPDF